MIPAAAPESPPGPRPWWETRWFVAAMILLSAVPLLYPPIPPLVDLLGHMGRYRVELDLANSPSLQRFYTFDWELIGNLGVDLLVYPLGKAIGLEPAVKLIVLSIPPLTVAGFLWVAREVHHRLPPTAAFALPFVYGHPFLFGFTNYALSMAFAFLAFGLWLRLGRLGKTRLRALVFVPISCALWVTHTFGWGMLGLLAFSAEAVRQHDQGRGWLRSGYRAAAHAMVMTLPILFMLLWRVETSGTFTGDWFNWHSKWMWLQTALRDRWKLFDQVSVAFPLLILLVAIAHPKLTLSRNLLFSGLVVTVAFICLPRIIFGSAYADMRLVPFLIATFILAIRFKADTDLKLGAVLARLGLIFVLVRTAAVTASLAMAADDQSAKLRAIDHIPHGARVVSLIGQPCHRLWEMPRNEHLGSMVVARREGFSNDHWKISGATLLGIHHPEAGDFAFDPSQRIRAPRCAYPEGWRTEDRIAAIPRHAFDYLWIMDPPPFDRAVLGDAELVWRGETSSLYRLPQGQANQPQ